MGDADLGTRLRASADDRTAMTRVFGFMPSSVLRGMTRGVLSNRLYYYQGERPSARVNASPAAARKLARLRDLGVPATASRKKVGRGSSAVSAMPAEVVAFFLRYYARPGDTYIDPFFGQGVRMQVAKLLGLHYHGYDASATFHAYVNAVRRLIDDGTTRIELHLGDSRTPSAIHDGIGDVCFTSPPYWDIEFYGDEPAQLGRGQTYEAFLVGMGDVARAWLPKFTPGGWLVLNVGDFRKDGRFYAYHADCIALFRDAGWLLHDTWILDGVVGGIAKAFAVSFNKKRIAPRVHEYALVFRRPSA